jgi:hypothetical protein
LLQSRIIILLTRSIVTVEESTKRSTVMPSEIRTAANLEAALASLLGWGDAAWEAVEAGIHSARTFADAGVPTQDRGLVLRLENGAAFQVTIVRSEPPRERGLECPECGDEQPELQAFLDHMRDDHDWDEYAAIDWVEQETA